MAAPDVRPDFAPRGDARRAAVESWLAMGDVGSLRRRPDGRIYLDFPAKGKRKRRLWSLHVGGEAVPFDERSARRVLERVRSDLADGRTLDEALARWLPVDDPAQRIGVRLERWLAMKRREVEAGDRSPTYLRELERYCGEGGHIRAWWGTESIYRIDYAGLEDWSAWLSDRGLSPKTRANVIGAFRAFCAWLVKRGELREIPREWPWPKVPEHAPRILSHRAQAALLAAIPEADRGIFLAMALMGIRPSEAVALRTSDYDPEGDENAPWGRLLVARARKGRDLHSPVRGTKTGRSQRLPVPELLAEWLQAQIPTRARLQGGPLFPNPRTGSPWASTTLRRAWAAACRETGLVDDERRPTVGLYEGTKHSFATDAVARGVPERSLQDYLRHVDLRTTRRYARLSSGALLEVIRRPGGATEDPGADSRGKSE